MCNQPGPSSIGNRVSSSCRLFALMLVAPLAMAARAADQPASPPPQPVLHLADGRSLPGEIRASTRPGVLRWQAASSGMPSEFAWKEVERHPLAAAGHAGQTSRRLPLRAGGRRRAVRLAAGPRRPAGGAGRPAAGPRPRATIASPSHRPMARRRRSGPRRPERPRRLARAERPEQMARRLGPTDNRPGEGVDPWQLRTPRSCPHRVRDLLEDQAGLRLRPGCG